MPFIYREATTHDLPKILALQKKNLPKHISLVERKEQGFVTVKHDLDILTKMNKPYGHICCFADETLVGYALIMLRNFANRVPVLIPMFQLIDTLAYNGQSLKDAEYFVMGQICIEKQYRGKELFSGLYRSLKQKMEKHFTYVITEIATDNLRSLRAHEKVGFECIHEYTANETGQEWQIVLWNWK